MLARLSFAVENQVSMLDKVLGQAPAARISYAEWTRLGAAQACAGLHGQIRQQAAVSACLGPEHLLECCAAALVCWAGVPSPSAPPHLLPAPAGADGARLRPAGMEAANKQMTTMLVLTGASMLPTLNPGSKDQEGAKDRLLMRLLPRASSGTLAGGTPAPAPVLSAHAALPERLRSPAGRAHTPASQRSHQPRMQPWQRGRHSRLPHAHRIAPISLPSDQSPAAAGRSVFVDDVVAFTSPLQDSGVMVRRVAALQGDEMVSSQPDEEAFELPSGARPRASSKFQQRRPAGPALGGQMGLQAGACQPGQSALSGRCWNFCCSSPASVGCAA